MLSLVDAEAVLEFWFGELDARGAADVDHERRWFQGGSDFDALCRERFLGVHAAVVAGEAVTWLESPRGRLATLIVLDQLSRNMFRGSSRMFENDLHALRIANDAIARGDERVLRFAERGFLYLPFEHSESLADQDSCVSLLRAFRNEVGPELAPKVDAWIDFAERHRDIIRRFGRFPHRNVTLERTSTAAELNFLKEPGSSF
ncbi:MAG TPA: DUF924 family protein [Polyangiaceae bacterium]|nr:DUF924 family protein [Polyangiaceae bacterium]